jgi:hypothetical protein
MIECVCSIIQINFSIFWKISCAVFVPSLVSLFYKDLPPKFEEYKKKIKESAGSDSETGIPYTLSCHDEKLLEYNLSVRLIWLIMCPIASLIASLIYFVCDKIPRISNSIWYNCMGSVLTVVGLLPVVLSIYLASSILVQLVRLYREAS